MNSDGSQKVLLGGTAGALVGVLVLPWYSANTLFGNVGLSAWGSGALGKLASIGRF